MLGNFASSTCYSYPNIHLRVIVLGGRILLASHRNLVDRTFGPHHSQPRCHLETTNAKVHVSPFSDIIGALQNILARSQVIIPNLETPFPIFPNTDHSTIELEGQSVLDIIAERQQQLDGVLHEALGLEAVMDGVKNLHQQLVEKKEKITQSMNLHKGFISPLWRFPNELLSQIFHDCLPDTLSRSDGLMLLIGICRRWREVATSTPSLWRRLYMQVNDTDWPRAASCYDSWLKWSRGLALSLAFSGIDIPELWLPDLPALEELTIYLDNGITVASMPQLPSTMRKFTAVLPSFEYRRYSIGPMWAHLTNVLISDVSQPVSVLKVLQLCPDLSSLTVRGSLQQQQTLEPLTHPKIQSLRIYYSPLARYLTRRSLSDLFNALSLPNLCALEARSERHDGVRWPHQESKRFLARSKCPLESLIFGSKVAMTDEERAEYTTLIPSSKIGIVEEHFPLTFR
ncbi:hypothetical protein EDB19DRAFT_2041609 [Suillus lakei]|nr:hypothetical protein EDB19DRAFT_2041609 [Suillus lakei]